MDDEYLRMLTEVLRNSRVSATGSGNRQSGGGQLDLRVPIGDVGITASGSGGYSPYGKGAMLNRVGMDAPLLGGRVGASLDPNDPRNLNVNYNRSF